MPSVLKSLCCLLSFASTCPCTGGWSVLPALLVDGGVDGVADGVAGVDGVVEVCGGVALEPDAAGRWSFLPHAARKARDNTAAATVVIFIQPSKVKVQTALQRKGLP